MTVHEAVAARTSAPGGADGVPHGASSARKIRIFISYAREDQKYKDVLRARLGRMREPVEVWADDLIKPGDQWSEEVKDAIKEADIALVLVSKYFLRSKFIRESELPWLKELAEAGTLRLIPLILTRQVKWQAQLGSFQALCAGEPIANVDNREGWEKAIKELAVLCGTMGAPEVIGAMPALREEPHRPSTHVAHNNWLRSAPWILAALALLAVATLALRWREGRRAFNGWLDDLEQHLDRGDVIEAGKQVAKAPTGWGVQPELVNLAQAVVGLYEDKSWDPQSFTSDMDALLRRSESLGARFKGQLLTRRASFELYRWNWDDAESSYAAALQMRKTMVNAWLGLGALHLWREDFQGALKLLTEGLEHLPESADLKAATAAAHAGAGSAALAAQLYEEATLGDAAYLPAYWELARLHRELGQAEKGAPYLHAAEDRLNEALPLDGGSPPIGYRVGREAARGLVPVKRSTPPPPVILLTTNARKHYYVHLSAALTACVVKDHDWRAAALSNAHRLVIEHGVKNQEKKYAELLVLDELYPRSHYPNIETETELLRSCIPDVLGEAGEW